MTTFFVAPAISANARTQQIVGFGGSGIAIPVYDTSLASGQILLFGPTGAYESTVYTSEPQTVAAAADDDYGFFAVGPTGYAEQIDASGVQTFAAQLPAMYQPYVGAAHCSGVGYFLSSSGEVVTQHGTPIGSFSGVGPYTQFRSYDSAYFASVSYGAAVALLSLDGVPEPNVPLPATGFAPSCLASSGADLLIGGWSNATFPVDSVTTFAENPVNDLLLFGAGNGFAYVFQNASATSYSWSTYGYASGTTGAPAYSAWTPNGTQIILTDPTNGTVQVLNFYLGALTIGQTLALTDASGVQVSQDGLYAIVCQPSQNQITVYVYAGGTWAPSYTIAVPGARAIAMLGEQMVVAGTNGLTYLTENSGAWSVSATCALDFAPTATAVDAYGIVYAANASDFAVVFNGVLIGSGEIYLSSATTIVPYQSQVLIADTVGGEIAIVGPLSTSSVDMAALSNNGGVVCVNAEAGYPTTDAGLSNGAVFSNGGVVCVVGTTDPNPDAPPVYFGDITPAYLLALGGANLPLTDPGQGKGQLYLNGGVVCIDE
jgi:hypothetical protein